MTGSDSDYLRDTVGEALARGVAATIAAGAPDPVDYLGNWLLRCVVATGTCVCRRMWSKAAHGPSGPAERLQLILIIICIYYRRRYVQKLTIDEEFKKEKAQKEKTLKHKKVRARPAYRHYRHAFTCIYTVLY